MANINEVITLGIGTPATIPYFIRFGLGSGAVVAVPTPSRERILYVGPRNNAIIVAPRLNVLYVPVREKLIHDF